MSNGMLSQEEIDALMKPKSEKAEPPFSPIELDALGEICNISMGSAATTLSNLLNNKVEITAPYLEIANINDLDGVLNPKFLAVVKFTAGFHGSSVLMLSQKDGGAIIDLLMGGDGHNMPEEFNEIHLSAIAETMNQMMGASATAISSMLGRLVDISPPQVGTVEMGSGLQDVFVDDQEEVIKISFNLKVEGLIDSTLVQVIPFNVAQEMVVSQLGDVRKSFVGSETNEPKSNPGDVQARENLQPQPVNAQVQAVPSAPVNVQPIQFAPLQPLGAKAEISNLDLILDVPLMVSVELGKARKTIKEILNFSPGSIIELDKLAGESVDLIANGKLLAKGEVVVINENFGLRITEIQSSLDKKLMTTN